MGTPLLQVQQAVYARLSGDSALVSLVTGVFDFVPQGQATPYVVVGDATDGAMDTFDHLGRLGVLTVRAWSQAHGFAAAATIADRVIILLDRQSLAGLVGYASVRTQYKDGMTRRETGVTSAYGSGITRSFTARFDIYVEATA